MKTFASFQRVFFAPPPKAFLWVIFSLFMLGDMAAQGLVIPGDIQFNNVNGDDPSGMRRMDVLWDNFSIPPSTDINNFTLDVRVNLTTNSPVGACISQQLSQAYIHPSIPVNSSTLTVSGNSIFLSVPNIEDLGLNGLEGTNPILLFSIVFIGSPNSTVTCSWQTTPFVPRIFTISGSIATTFPMVILNNNRPRNISSNSISGSIYKPAFIQANCNNGQTASVTQVQITKTPNISCGTTIGSSTITNNNNGTYSFSNIPGGSNLSLPSNFDYTISPMKTNGVACGLNGLDLTIVSQHLNGVDFFDYPYQIIAADMNLSGNVSGSDYVLLQQVINGNQSGLPSNWRSWTFPPTAVYGTFPPVTSNTYLVPVFSESLQFNDLNANQTVQDFVGIKRGDIDGSCTQCNAAFDGGGSEERSSTQNSIVINDRAIQAGETLELPLLLDEEWDEDNNVISFALQFDPAYFEVQTVRDGQLSHFDENSFNWEAMDDGLVRCVWVNNYGEKQRLAKADALLYIVLNTKQAAPSLRELVTLRTDLQDCSIVTTKLEQAFLGLKIVEGIRTPETLQAYPNPLGEELNIVFNQELEGGTALVEVFSTDGRRLYTLESLIEKGQNTFTIPASNFTRGLLTYRVATNGKMFSGRVIKN